MNHRHAKGLPPDHRVLDLVRAYLADQGLSDYQGDTPYHPVYPDVSKGIADWYDLAPHKPSDPRVTDAYGHMASETLDQFNHLRRAGVQLEPWLHEGQPYRNSAEMREDALGGHLHYFLGGEWPQGHLLARKTPVTINGHPHSYNDLFRAVHDYFGHALYGNEFGPRGEEHAWRTHGRMYSPRAKPAMSMETRGQNSWVNFGKHLRRPDGSVPSRGEPDFIPQQNRPYAQQKMNVLPEQYLNEA